MNEMELLMQYRGKVPASEAAAKAELALMEAIRQEQRAPEPVGTAGRPAHRPAWRPVWRPAAVGGLATAVAGGLIAVLVITPGAAPSASALTVGKLSNLAAAAALRQAGVQPRQWVYWEKKFTGEPTSPHVKGLAKVWSTADAARAAIRSQGELKLARCMKIRWAGPCTFIGGQAYAENIKTDGDVTVLEAFPWTARPVTYRELGSLPQDPRTLNRHLSALGFGPGGPSARAFTLIDFLLTTYVMPPRLTAELYHALGALPRVTLDRHAVDAAGRHGVGFRIRSGTTEYEIILNPRTYRLMGDSGYYGASAILHQARVTGPGKTR
ncbi:MAG TPA: CU044_5270 family protein [Streptosporangiaceae bacterium]|nr:CU044_5270 family protein [Streptosporangiaceae bacterium]